MLITCCSSCSRLFERCSRRSKCAECEWGSWGHLLAGERKPEKHCLHGLTVRLCWDTGTRDESVSTPGYFIEPSFLILASQWSLQCAESRHVVARGDRMGTRRDRSSVLLTCLASHPSIVRHPNCTASRPAVASADTPRTLFACVPRVFETVWERVGGETLPWGTAQRRFRF